MLYCIYESLPSTLAQGGHIGQVKAIVITGKGPMFCGGAEITELLGRGRTEQEIPGKCKENSRNMQEIPAKYWKIAGKMGRVPENVNFAMGYPSTDVAFTIQIPSNNGNFNPKNR